MACLVVVDGPDAGRHFALAQHSLVAVGRDEECTFQITDPKVSRHHLQIKLDQTSGGHEAADYRSANGVYINGQQILSPTPLQHRDVILIGGTQLVYSRDDYTDAEAATAGVRQQGQWKRSTIVRK